MGNIQKIPTTQKTGWPWNEEVDPILYGSDLSIWPKISIVTPSFNQGKYIEETMRSILLQNYPNLEYIVMDGGSTDETIEIIKSYSPWISFWVSEKDKGQSDALVKGFNRSSGVLLNWINSDDFLSKNGLFNIAKAYISDSSLGFIHGRNSIVNIDSKEIGQLPHPKDNLSLRYFYEMPYGQQACFFSKQLYLKVGGINPYLRFSMDYELYLRMHLMGAKTIQIDETIGMYRHHEETKTNKMEEVMHKENGDAFMTFLFSLGENQKGNFMKSIGHKSLNSYQFNSELSKNKIRRAYCEYLNKNIWFYYNTQKSKIASKIAIELMRISPLKYVNWHMMKIAKDGINKINTYSLEK